MVAESPIYFADNVRYVKLDILRTQGPNRPCLTEAMPIVLEQPRVDQLEKVIEVLRNWQYEGAPMQLHPGDLGWSWRFGPDALAAALRTWSRDEQTLAIGFLDSPNLLRLALAPQAQDDEELAQQLVVDASQPERGVLPLGTAYVEARCGELVPALLRDGGWSPDEPWTPLSRSLSDAVDAPRVRIEVVGADLVTARVAVQRAAFSTSTFSEDRWRMMASGVAYADARCLLAFDADNNAVATVTVWSAGPGKPGLLEPMGVHHEHRGHGYATAITLAAASALRELGLSSAIVCTGSDNVSAIAAYASAGFEARPEVRDWRRDA
jgi:GNAT superfamily N-acetyltransferase